jgi:hypothetical protein
MLEWLLTLISSWLCIWSYTWTYILPILSLKLECYEAAELIIK